MRNEGNIVDKRLPVLFAEKKDCCGCTACAAVCPKNAILMKSDEEGFLYPIIDEYLCNGCRKCIRVCPIKRMEILSE